MTNQMTPPPAVVSRPRAVLIGLAGTGVTPSLSPAMHELEGARHGMNYVYRTIDLVSAQTTADHLSRLLASARVLGFNGLNITHPIKQTVIPLLDELAPSAETVGAVNTVVFEDGRMIGHNTDVTGFGGALDSALPDSPRSRVVLVGAGGAGSAVATALATRVDRLDIVDIDDSRARRLAAVVGAQSAAQIGAAPRTDLPALLGQADGVVNATPFGMADHPGTPFDPQLLKPATWVADIVYRPVETALLRAARQRGCPVMSGLGMVMRQAADAFEIFTGEIADRDAMLNDLRNLVTAESAGTVTPLHKREE